MKDYKRIFALYSAWDYTREIEDLNRRSEQGWQLIKGGLFSSLFKKNNDIRYRYQLDFNTKIEDMGRYIETFHEQGWEYVNSTWNGWHYFRKIYDPSLDGEEFEIYNDSESLKEMQAKWQKLGIALTVICGLMAILNGARLFYGFKLPTFVLALVMLFEAFVIGRGVFVLRNPQRADGHRRSWNGMLLFFTVLLIGCALSIVLIETRGYTSVNTSAESYMPVSASVDKGVNWSDIKINYPDFYTFEVNGTASVPITLSLVNQDSGKIEAQIRLDSAKAENKKGFRQKQQIYLKPGNYSIIGTDFAGGSIDIHMSLD